MAKCVCKDGAGHGIVQHVQANCAPPLPISLRPTLYMMVHEITSAAPSLENLACRNVLEFVKKDIGVSLDTWFDLQYKALDALGSSVEYATATFDSKAGRCLDFQNDPHIVVLVPQPVDYFRRCGGTSRCRLVCSNEWRAFQDSLAAAASTGARTTSIDVSMESLFFPGEASAELVLANAIASVELPASLGKCLARPRGAPDYSLAVAEAGTAGVRVTFWCAPRNAGSPVYRSESQGLGPVVVPGTLLALQFGDDSGEWLAALTQETAGVQTAYVVSRAGISALPALRTVMDPDHELMRVENLWVIEGAIVVDLVTRHMTSFRDGDTGHQSARSEAEAMHFFVCPYPPGGNATWNRRWTATGVDLMQFGGGQYWYTRLAPKPGAASDDKREYLFLPKVAGMQPYRLRFSPPIQGRIVLDEPQAMTPARLSQLSGTVLAASSQGEGYMFATSTDGWDWLKQVRIADGFVEGVYGSADVKVAVQIQGNCDAQSCEGCATLQTQRMCLAYNRCSLINCVGTPVHQRRPLCGIGALLRHNGGMALRSSQAAWTIFAEMLALTMQMSLLSLHDARLLWPEDQFLCYVCQAKDRSAEFFSILTATVNSALQLSDVHVGFMFGGASNVDTNADAVLTISSTALNGFLHQVALLPLYAMVIAHKVVMCQVSGVIALMDGSGFSISLKPAGESAASDIIAGQCLTVGAETMAAYPTDKPATLGVAVTSIASNAVQRLFLMQIEPFLHVIDGGMAYLIGVVQSLGVLIMAQNAARCNPPDFNLKNVVNCACDDHRLAIPAARSLEGVLESAHWCTGVLGMIDSSNQPYYVYNKFTYAQLQAMSGGLAEYTQCVGRGVDGYRCPVPNDPWFEAQGVTTINVLVKCRENFMRKRWDPSAYMLFQPASWSLLRLRDGEVPVLPGKDPYGVQQCLREGDATRGAALVMGCLEEFLLPGRRDLEFDEYWMYERTDATRPGPEFTDACLAFSGPGEVRGIAQFAACVDGASSSTGCTHPQHLWTPQSDNNIPTAEQHKVASYGMNMDGLVQRMYQSASDLVVRAAEDSLSVWNDGTGTDAVDVEFFSVEGDVLHQTMDCIFMGPYSRVDYWPAPVCPPGAGDGQECLRGPFWSRDEGEGQGRGVDPGTCDAPTSLPYTCGSPARKSLMRYLVKSILGKGVGARNQNVTAVQSILRETLKGIRADWNDTSRFGCDCGVWRNGSGPFRPACCRTYRDSPLLPPFLNKTFTSLNSTTVLQALQSGMAELYEHSLESIGVWMEYMADVAPGERAEYDWTDSQRVEDEARYNPAVPTQEYSSSSTGGEAMSPFARQDSTLWDACHGALKQVFFTLPVAAGGQGIQDDDPDGLGAFDGDPARLEAFVRRFTREAFERSPLFRHYSPRHAPSRSQMCRDASPPANDILAEGLVSFTDFVQADVPVLSGADLASAIPAYHPQRFRVGVEGACLCGWQRVGAGRCVVPAKDGTADSVCAVQGVQCTNEAGAIGYNQSLHQRTVEAAFRPTWFCPEFELSAHWGLMDHVAAERWLAKNATSLLTSSRDLLQHGRAGLRAANLQTLSGQAKEAVAPGKRAHPIDHYRLGTCVDRGPPPEDLARGFVDDLFPAAQAVEESGSAAYCLRYAIELARLHVLELLDLPELQGELASQWDRMEVWRGRCGVQLHLLHMCVSLGVYRPLVIPRSNLGLGCPHFQYRPAGTETRVVYVTPQCLVSVDGVFYDPCRCTPCAGQSTSLLNLSRIVGEGAACQLRFDPRTVLARGHPIGWTDGVDPMGGRDPASSLLDTPAFIRAVWDDPDAVGNAETGERWWDAEGPMSENSEFCDGVLDWWPESWDFPVGYHVTVPCEADATAYRSFAQAFALDEQAGTLVYQHDLLRDATLMDSHFGVGGLCRSSNVGMPMPETNNVRYCTRMPLDDTEDFTLAASGAQDATDAGGWTPWKCATSSRDLPWPDASSEPDAPYQSARFSVGTVPNMPPQNARTYPASEDDMLSLGPWQEISPGANPWGVKAEQLCQDFALRVCLEPAQCPEGYACRGRVCSNDPARQCTADSGCGANGQCRGVCMDSLLVQCIMHSDCPDDKMCSGMGTCQTAVLAVQNRLELQGDDIDLSLAVGGESSECGPSARAYSLVGGSYWGNTADDLLRAHGMCSFEDWFKYTSNYAQSTCSVQQADGTLLANPSQCTVTDLQEIETNQTKWWPAGRNRPEFMYLRPTTCDRDYERLQGFAQCAPVVGAGAYLLQDNRAVTALQYDRFVRLHEDRAGIRLAAMPERTALSTGFLGMGGTVKEIKDLDPANDPGAFVPCGSVGQCYPGDFFVNGANRGTNRSYYDPGSNLWQAYPPRTPFVCGVFGIEGTGGQGCRLDTNVLPLYRMLCIDELPSCTQFDLAGVRSICNDITPTYQPSITDRTRILAALRKLFRVFPAFKTFGDYLRLTSCANDLYSGITAWAASAASGYRVEASKGLYFPFMFALYEFPFDWFFQCVMLSGRPIDETTRTQQDCQAFSTRDQHAIDGYTPVSRSTGDSFDTYLRYVKGGYSLADVQQYEAAQRERSEDALAQAKEEVRARMFPGDAARVDKSYPRCSQNLLWRIGPHGRPLENEGFAEILRAIIWNWDDAQACQQNWQHRLIANAGQYGITDDNWYRELTRPDEVNLDKQPGSGSPTMLELVAGYIRAHWGVESLDGVRETARGCIQFSNRPPSAYDESAGFPVPEILKPSDLYTRGGTTRMDDTVNRTCAFIYQYDPAFQDILASPGCGEEITRTFPPTKRVDRLLRCGGRDCTSVPVAYARDGLFSCRYIAEGVIPRDCTQDRPGCYEDVLKAIYDAVYTGYLAKLGSDLPPVSQPTLLPLFERDPAKWPFSGGFSLSKVLDYERNIQPNPERTVMCELSTTAEDAIKFTTCNSPHYAQLKQHVEKYYKRDGGVVVPAGAQLEWPVGRAVLQRGILLAYSNMNKSIGRRFMDGLFDDQTVCKGESALQVCRKENTSVTKFRSVNPWLLGKFNPYEACDVDFTDQGDGGREYIFDDCIRDGNPACKAYNQREIPIKCKSEHLSLVTRPGVPRTQYGSPVDYNLCHHRLVEDQDGCMHDQGLLGGYDGLPVSAPMDTSQTMLAGTPYEASETYRVALNLYENSTWSIPADFRAGFFSDKNPLWRGDFAPYGHLQITETDIGGHRIGVVVGMNTSDEFSTMAVEQISLGLSEDGRYVNDRTLNTHAGRPVSEWVGTLRARMEKEDREVAPLYTLAYPPGQLGASCPLKRWMFYSGDNAEFSPTIPSAQRAKRLFHRIHGGLVAHPTMQRAPKGAFLGKYRSSNGFCACPVMKDTPQVHCLVPATTSASPCSLASTIKALRGDGQVFSSQVFLPIDSARAERQCRMSLDWPAVRGVLRDGSTVGGDFALASDPANEECHVLDRFRPFQYKYEATQDLRVDPALNTASHGVCQTRRVVTLDLDVLPSGYTRCMRATTEAGYARFTCNVTGSGGKPQMSRRTRLSAEELHRRRAALRTSCSKCSPPPAFVSQNGAPIQSESSFGRLHRWSAERLLAKDLRDAICGPNSTRCDALLNRTAWRRKEFMNNFMHAPHRLFLPIPGGGGNLTRPPSPTNPEPASRWEAGRPWVYCPNQQALVTGEGCQGVMSRAEWTRSKTSLCPQMVRSFSTTATNTSDGDPMARTTFCSVDNTTDAVCLAIATARDIIRQANCIARGNVSCMPSPFVYHPASYDPSNNAWTHDSVRAFYMRFDSNACPAVTSAEQQSLRDFARTYQQGCPANAVNLVVSILQIVRVVATEVALLLSTLVGMVVKTLALFLPGRAADMRQYIAADWQYVRTKARALLDTSGDLLVDAMLNSGELGARVMGFLQRACTRINEAIAWFLNVWCNYIQQYMIQVLAGLRHAMGIMGAGFDMLQDFVDEIFQGILPAAFVAKYAQKGFKEALVEAYSKPTDKKGKGKTNLNVPDTVNARPSSKKSKSKNILSKTTGFLTGPTGKTLGKAAGFATAALTMYEMVNGVMGIIEEENLRKLWPENFTLFDLSGVVDALDDMERFLLMDDSCYEFQLSQRLNTSYNRFPCVNLEISQYAATTQGTTSIVATQCWANAQPQLGQNSLFSCSAASTCCRTTACTDYILCSACADTQLLPGVTKYGCDGLQQRCTCGLTRLVYDRCSANRQCGVTSQCELVSSLNSISYGTIPCANCPPSARVMCLLPSSGFPGRCSCMLDSVKGYDLCSDLTGTRTPVTGTRLCAYLQGSMRPSTWVFDMDDLVTLPCNQVKSGVCSTVIQAGGQGAIQMVVAESILVSSSGSTSGRRRLLATDDPEQVVPDPGPPTYDAYESEYELTDSAALHALLVGPGWNTTSAPCSTLALAYQAGRELGILETHVLHKCGFWRYVGRRVIRGYNLTHAMAGHETFLLSMDDFVYALMTPGVALVLARNPGLLGAAAMYHPWFKPVRAFGVLVANQLEKVQWLRDIDADMHDVLFGDDPPDTEQEEVAWDRMAKIRPRLVTGRAPGFKRDPPQASPGPNRRLLASTVLQDSVQSVQPFPYSGSVLGSNTSAGAAYRPSNAAGAWGMSTFSWPPRYDYSFAACPIGQSILHIAMQAFRVNKLYYQNFDAPRPAIDRSLRGNLPSWSWVNNISAYHAGASSGDRTWASAAFHWILDTLVITPSQLVAFFADEREWSLQWILQTTIQCDLAAVVTCSRHTRDLLMSTVVFAILYALISGVMGSLGLGFFSTLFLLSYPWFILWYAFGMAPSCFPMIPPCLMGDIIATAEMLVPKSILFPTDLLCDPASQAGRPLNQTCLRPCSDLNFTTWADPLAFAICDTDPRTCEYLLGLGLSNEAFFDSLVWKPMLESLAQAHAAVLAGELAGHRLCTWVSFIMVVPVLALTIGAIVVASAVLTGLFDLLPALVAFLGQLYVFYDS